MCYSYTGKNLSKPLGRFVSCQSTLDGLSVNKPGKLVSVEYFGNFGKQPALVCRPTVPGEEIFNQINTFKPSATIGIIIGIIILVLLPSY